MLPRPRLRRPLGVRNRARGANVSRWGTVNPTAGAISDRQAGGHGSQRPFTAPQVQSVPIPPFIASLPTLARQCRVGDDFRGPASGEQREQGAEIAHGAQRVVEMGARRGAAELVADVGADVVDRHADEALRAGNR